MKVQVVTATKHGSTAEVGAAIAQRLHERGYEVRSFDASEADRLSPEGAVVLGSPIYMSKWLKPARAVLDQLAAEPAGRAVFVFSVGPVGDPPKPEDAAPEAEVAAFAAERASGSAIFAGKLDSSKLSRLERLAIRAVKAPNGDYRDWIAIRDWADLIANDLTAGEVESRVSHRV
jgi:menaquinone-dependent protoporphyrinogen oxidase